MLRAQCVDCRVARAVNLAGTRPCLLTLTFAGTAATGGADDVGGGAAGADAGGERRTECRTEHASCPAAAAALAWVGPPRMLSCTACSARPIPPATIVPAVIPPQARVCAAALARGPPHGCPRTSTTRVSIAPACMASVHGQRACSAGRCTIGGHGCSRMSPEPRLTTWQMLSELEPLLKPSRVLAAAYSTTTNKTHTRRQDIGTGEQEPS